MAEHERSHGLDEIADVLADALRAALVPHVKALEYLCAYMGWSTEPLDAYIDQINVVFGTVLQSPAAESPGAP